MNKGWIKLHRVLLDKPIWRLSTPPQKVILVTLLMMANHRDTEWEWKGERFVCERGQFITSLDKIVKNSGRGVTIAIVRTALARFEKYEFLINESTNSNRLITICNWEDYQLEVSDEVKPVKNIKGSKEDIEEIYKLYPTRCPITKRGTGKGAKNKAKIGSLLKSKDTRTLSDTIKWYVEDCKYTGTYLMNFSTFLNNLPDLPEGVITKEEENLPKTKEGIVLQ